MISTSNEAYAFISTIQRIVNGDGSAESKGQQIRAAVDKITLSAAEIVDKDERRFVSNVRRLSKRIKKNPLLAYRVRYLCADWRELQLSLVD